MFKNKIKAFLSLFAILTLITTFSFGAEPITISEDQNTISTNATTDTETTEETTDLEESSEEDSSEEQEIYYDDLYLFGDSVVMDQLVDGNVYIMANRVSVTGQINGNLFVFAQDFSLEEAYVRNSIFLCASNATFNGACTDLYAACSVLNISYDSYIARDSRIACDSLVFQGLNNRNMFITASNIDFGSDNQMATIYGNLNYTSNQELSLEDGIVSGEVNYTPMEVTDTKSATDFLSILTSIVSTLIYSIVIYFIICWFTPKFQEGISQYASSKIISTFLIGLAALILIPIISFILLFSSFVSGLAIAIFAIYALLISIAFTIFALFITKLIMKKFSKIPEFLLFIIVIVILALLRMVPYISWPVSFIMGTTGFGIIVMSLLRSLPKSNNGKKIVETTTVENTTNSNNE